MSNTGLLNALEELCQKGASGMLIAVTEDNHHIRIGLQKGEVVHLATHRLQGGAALAAIVANSCRSFNFTPGSALQVQSDLPAAEVILNALRTGQYSESETDFAAVPQPTGNATGSTTGNAAGISANVLHMIEEELTEYVGPIASVLILESKNQPTLGAVLQKLAKELPTAAAKEAFFSKVKARLKAG